ncbi:MAG: LysR substrate-binding domain-containing protein [Rubrivivax sp.]
MELRHLRYFIAAAEEEHFGRAADRLHVTRPAVSQLVADLESELDTALFERRGARVHLSAAGRALLPRVQAVMRDLDQAFTLTRQVGRGKTGALDIGFGALALAHPIFRAAIQGLRAACPDVNVTIHEMPSGQQRQAIEEGRLHAGFMHFALTDEARRSAGPAGTQRLHLQTGGLGVAVAQGHPLAQRRSLSLAELHGEPFVVVTCSSVNPSFGRLYALCQQAGFEPQIVREVDSMARQLNLVSVGAGIGLIVTGAHYRCPEGVAVVPLDDVDYPTTFALEWSAQCREPALQRFIGIVEALMQELRMPGPPPQPQPAGARVVPLHRPKPQARTSPPAEPPSSGPLLLCEAWHRGFASR